MTDSNLYYGRALDHTILPALNELGTEQAQPTQKTMDKVHRLMDYANTYPDVYIRYYASDMVLRVDNNVSHLVAPKAQSRVAGYYHLSDHPDKTTTPKLNKAISVECKSLQHVVASAAEAEIVGIFHNAQITIPVRILLQALGSNHLHLSKPITLHPTVLYTITYT